MRILPKNFMLIRVFVLKALLFLCLPCLGRSIEYLPQQQSSGADPSSLFLDPSLPEVGSTGRLLRSREVGQLRVDIYSLEHNKLPIVDFYELRFYRADSLVGMRKEELPQHATSYVVDHNEDPPDFDWLESIRSAHRVYWFEAESEHLVPAWEVSGTDLSGVHGNWIIDTQSEAILRFEDTTFSMTTAPVFPVGGSKTETTDVGLPIPENQTTLDHEWLSVFSPDESSPRAESWQGRFQTHPDHPDFDQIQAFYTAHYALNWFKELGEYSPKPITVRINSNVSGKNNAGYNGDLSLISVGTGDQIRMTNLARDTDVMLHEVVHHVVFDTLKTRRNETGIVHEALADFFTYAMTGDGDLAETILIGKPYLRSAVGIGDARYDDPRESEQVHHRGNILSSMLWGLRNDIGPALDLTIYSGLAFMQPDSGIRDLLTGIINADLALSEGERFGDNYCPILRHAIGRGFATYLEDLDGSPCELDMKQSAADSRDYAAGILGDDNKSTDPQLPSNIFGHPCGVSESRGNLYGWIVVMLSTLPLLFRRHFRVFPR